MIRRIRLALATALLAFIAVSARDAIAVSGGTLVVTATVDQACTSNSPTAPFGTITGAGAPASATIGLNCNTVGGVAPTSVVLGASSGCTFTMTNGAATIPYTVTSHAAAVTCGVTALTIDTTPPSGFSFGYTINLTTGTPSPNPPTAGSYQDTQQIVVTF